MRLVIAEKPSLGRAIADALPDRFEQIRQGKGTVALRGRQIVVTWAFGHILEMANPEHYDPRYKSWRVEDLPIAPEKFVLKEKEPAQLKVIADLLKNADECVNAGDPDREGQLLIDEILEYLGWRGKTLRLLPHATDPESIRKAWDKLQPNEKFLPLYKAALCRQRADWLVGINASRAATLLLTTRRQLVPLGRVMTPTLALVVLRDREIEDFVPRSFWVVHIDVQTEDKKTFTLVYDPDPHIFDKKQAEAIANSIVGKTLTLEVSVEKRKERAPLPWHLGLFQSYMQKHHGLTLQQSLETLQSLYEKQLASYPRTECRYLPLEQKDDAIPIMRKVGPVALDRTLDESLLEPKSYVYDNSKVAEHHGLVPTGKIPSQGQLTAIEESAWKALVQHFAKTLLPHREYIEQVLQVRYGDAVFRSKGEVSLNWDQSWRMFDQREEEQPLADVENGTMVKVVAARLSSGTTTSPQRYTEATLAADMEAVAKYVTDERIKARLKETSGIGTAATRSAIIEKLKEKGMLQTLKKNKTTYVISTAFGREVIDAVPPVLKNPWLTAVWEEALNQIARQEYESDEFMQRTVKMVSNLIEQMKNSKDRPIKSDPIQASSAASTSSAASSKKTASKKTAAPRKTGNQKASPSKAK